jgi:hypothetical protein
MTEIPEDPLALLQGTSNSLIIRGEQGITGIMVNDPSSFLELVGYTYYAGADNALPDTFGGDELLFVRGIDNTAMIYAEYIQNAADNGVNSVEYPNSSVASQLGSVAKLISGGMYSPFYIVYQNGYDTHNDQTNRHNQLMNQLNGALYSFYTDLSNQGLSEDVIILTTSEFGRRPFQNGTGTDHGAASVQFLLGDKVNGGLFGSPPDLANVDQNSNLIYEFDFRRIFSSLLSQFMGLDDATVSNTLNGIFEPLDLISTESYGSGDVNNDGSLNVIDIVLMVNYILQYSDFTPEQFEAGDMNGDGEVNILDIVAAVGLILDGNFGELSPNSPYELKIQSKKVILPSQSNLAGIQFDISSSKVKIENQNDNWICRTNGKRVIAYSTNGKPMKQAIKISAKKYKLKNIIAANFSGKKLSYSII